MRTKALLTIFMLFVIAACSQDEANVSVEISQNPFPLIPATAVSCLAIQNAAGNPPTSDISASYFRVPVVTFNRKDTTKNLFIAFIRINIQIPGTSTPVNCEYGGDALAALAPASWFSGTKEALVPAGNPSFSTSCALYCGGITMPNANVATGTMQVFGYEETTEPNPKDRTQTPVNVETSISIQGF